MTRAQAKKFKDALNGIIQEVWAQENSSRPTKDDPHVQQGYINVIQTLEEFDPFYRDVFRYDL